ncbi:MAG TPA: hypothetical protein VF264_02550 [Rhodanobacteraceae bacterium]
MTLSVLGDVLRGVETGKSFQTAEVLARPDQLGVLKVSAVSWNAFRADQAKLVVNHQPDDRHRVRAGDLIISRANTRELVGAVVRVSQDYPLRLLSDKTLRLVIDATKADPDYLLLALRTERARAHIEANATGTSDSMRNISQGVIASIPIWIPRLSVQRRIAARLKAKLADVETARRAAQAQVADADALRLAIYREVFAGLADADFVPIRRLAQTTSGTTPSRGRKDYWDPPAHPWVKTAEVAFAPITKTQEAISTRALAECSLSLLPVGTVLVAMYGQGKTRGQSAVLHVPATINQACFAVLPSDVLDSEYLQCWLQSSYQALRALSDARGGNQSNLNGAMLGDFRVPVVSPRRQLDVVRSIAHATGVVDQLRAAAQSRLADLEALPARLLAAAFNPSNQGAAP